ncbi:hypothetical protein [Nereida ignava]|uniref:hypothetical protein n=1 Tax=Nereida ignava TaxID=282199 RepID=UPI0030F77C0D
MTPHLAVAVVAAALLFMLRRDASVYAATAVAAAALAQCHVAARIAALLGAAAVHTTLGLCRHPRVPDTDNDVELGSTPEEQPCYTALF